VRSVCNDRPSVNDFNRRVAEISMYLLYQLHRLPLFSLLYPATFERKPAPERNQK
jgi:hypothetical protein